MALNLVDKLEQCPGILWRLIEDKDEHKLVKDAAGKGEPPEGRMRPQKGSVRHYGHAQRDPEKDGRYKATLAVMDAVLDRRLDEGGVDEAADEHDQHGDGVGPPKVAGFIRVLHLALFFLLISCRENLVPNMENYQLKFFMKFWVISLRSFV